MVDNFRRSCVEYKTKRASLIVYWKAEEVDRCRYCPRLGRSPLVCVQGTKVKWNYARFLLFLYLAPHNHYSMRATTQRAHCLGVPSCLFPETYKDSPALLQFPSPGFLFSPVPSRSRPGSCSCPVLQYAPFTYQPSPICCRSFSLLGEQRSRFKPPV